eukprot:1290377-Prymnesium_polylepis.2
MDHRQGASPRPLSLSPAPTPDPTSPSAWAAHVWPSSRCCRRVPRSSSSSPSAATSRSSRATSSVRAPPRAGP